MAQCVAATGRDADCYEQQIPQGEAELGEAEANLGQPFKHAQLLALTREQLAEVDKQMLKTEEGSASGAEGPTLSGPDP